MVISRDSTKSFIKYLRPTILYNQTPMKIYIKAYLLTVQKCHEIHIH